MGVGERGHSPPAATALNNQIICLFLKGNLAEHQFFRDCQNIQHFLFLTDIMTHNHHRRNQN